MMTKALVLLSVASITCAFSFSEKEKGWKDHAFTEKDLRRQPASVEMPAGLWGKVEEFARATGALKAEDEIDTEFVSLRAFLIEKNRGILGRENFELKFPVGGGEMDLGDFLQPLKGSFYFATDFLPNVDSKAKKVFFVSNSQARTLMGTKVGAGCDSYFDVTSAFTKAMAGPGFLVNTTDGRHVGALVGTYFFLGFEAGKLRISTLIVRDSRFRSLQCRRG
ncbi:MAG: hypothetical protein V4760_17645 [Bdellovibrionota bacterium]